jgi:hypothetical protein
VMATIWSIAGLNRDTAAVIVLLCALAAVAVGAQER